MTTAQASTVARPGDPPHDKPRHGRHELAWLIEHRAQILASIAVTAIAVGGLLHAFGSGAAGDAVWGAAVALLAAELAFEVGAHDRRRPQPGRRHDRAGRDGRRARARAGARRRVVGLMFSGGAALEDVASRARAPRADRADSARPEGRAASRRRPASRRCPSSRSDRRRRVVRTGEVVPVDGTS